MVLVVRWLVGSEAQQPCRAAIVDHTVEFIRDASRPTEDAPACSLGQIAKCALDAMGVFMQLRNETAWLFAVHGVAHVLLRIVAVRMSHHLHVAIAKIRGNASGLELRGIERIDAHVGVIQRLLRAQRNLIQELAATLVLPRRSLFAPVGEYVVARNPNQGLMSGNCCKVPRNVCQNEQRISLGIAAHGTELRIDRGAACAASCLAPE